MFRTTEILCCLKNVPFFPDLGSAKCFRRCTSSSRLSSQHGRHNTVLWPGACAWCTVTRDYTGLPCGFQCLLHPAYLVPVCRRYPVTQAQQSCNSSHQRIRRCTRNRVYKIPGSKQEVRREEQSGNVRRAQPFWCLHSALCRDFKFLSSFRETLKLNVFLKCLPHRCSS